MPKKSRAANSAKPESKELVFVAQEATPQETSLAQQDTNEYDQQAQPTTKPWKVISLAIACLALLALVIILVSGFDRQLLSASLQGQVLDTDNNPIPNSKILLDEIKNAEFSADAKGFFKISYIPAKRQVIAIKADSYQENYQLIDFARLENKIQNFTLKKLDYGFISGKLVGQNLNLEEVSLKISDKEVKLNPDGSFISDRLALGPHSLKVESLTYKNIVQEITVNPGSNSLPEIKLEQAPGFQFKIVDWANSQPISSATLYVSDLKLTSNALGEVEVDRKVDLSKFNIKVEKAGYISYNQPFSDSKSIIELVPQGKIAYTKDQNGKSRLFSANYDGTDEKQLSLNEEDVYRYGQINSEVYYIGSRNTDEKGYNGNSKTYIYSVNINGGAIKPMINFLENNYSPNQPTLITMPFLSAGKLVIHNDGVQPATGLFVSEIFVQNLDGKNQKTIRTRSFPQYDRESVNIYNTILSPDGSKIAYIVDKYEGGSYSSRGSRILKVETDGSGAQEVASIGANDNMQLIGFTNDNRKLLYYYSGDNSLKIFDLVTKKTETSSNVLSLGQYYQASKFYQSNGDSNLIYFILRENNNQNLATLNITTKEVKKLTDSNKVTAFFIDRNTDIIYYRDDTQTKILRPGQQPIKASFESNFSQG